MLIGLTGRAQAGKDTVFERATHLLAQYWAPLDHNVERRSFADLLYKSAAASLGVPEEHLRLYKSDPEVTIEITHRDLGPLYMASARQYLQRYGTEAHRNLFGSDFWVDALDLTDHHDRVVFVTDVRFDNEAEAIRDAGGVVVEVVGPEAPSDSHPSEAGVPRDLIAFHLDNTTRGDDFAALDSGLRFLFNLLGLPCASA